MFVVFCQFPPFHIFPRLCLGCSPPSLSPTFLFFNMRMRQNCVEMQVGVHAKFRLGLLFRFASPRHRRGEKRPDPVRHKQTDSCQTHTLSPLHSLFFPPNLRCSFTLILIHFTLSFANPISAFLLLLLFQSLGFHL